jgi:hypothetical protein
LILRTCETGALGSAATASVAAAAEVEAAAAAGASATSPTGSVSAAGVASRPCSSSISLRLLANWAISFELTSPMIPRPNWATLPVMCRSVLTTTFVLVGDRLSAWAVISAEALPRPPVSRPTPLMTARYAASSRSRKLASPLNWLEIAPSLILTTPR